MKLKNETKVDYVDTETGEIATLTTSKTYSVKVKSDKFYMTFIDYALPVFRLKSDNARKVLDWMCMHAEYNTGAVHLTAKAREQMALDINICNNTITNNLAKLKRLDLISGDKGEFLINPLIFWKGDSKTRDKLLENNELQITFKIN